MWHCDSIDIYTVQEGPEQEYQKYIFRKRFKIIIKSDSWFLYIYHSEAFCNQECKKYEDKEQVTKI